MNSFLLKLQKNTFFVLLPIVLLLAYSLAYVIRSVIILLIPEPAHINRIIKDDRSAINQYIPKPVNTYEETVTGNFIRGIIPNEIKVGGTPGEGGNVAAVDVPNPDADDMMVTGCVSGSPSFARVAFREKGKDEAEEFAIGQKIFGYRVTTIAEHHAVLFKNGQYVKIEIGETLKDARARITEAPAISASSIPGNCQNLKKMISRTDFERTLKDPTLIYKDTRFGPNLVDGKIDGYKIFQVSASHVFYALGARNGDIIRRVNGMPLQDTEKMMEIWNNIKNSTKITVDIDRKGVCYTYDFTVRN